MRKHLDYLFMNKYDRAFCKYKCHAQRNEERWMKIEKELEKERKHRARIKKVKNFLKTTLQTVENFI